MSSFLQFALRALPVLTKVTLPIFYFPSKILEALLTLWQPSAGLIARLQSFECFNNFILLIQGYQRKRQRLQLSSILIHDVWRGRLKSKQHFIRFESRIEFS